MVGMNLGPQLMAASVAAQAPSASTSPTTEVGQSPATDFEQLLQGLSQTDPSTESALPELLAVVASLMESSNLLEGIEKPVGSAETPKNKKHLQGHGPAEGNPLAALQALPGIVPQACPNSETPVTTAEPNQPVTVQEAPPVALELETPKSSTPEKLVLNLKDFDVRRFDFKSEIEIAVSQPKLIRVAALPSPLLEQWKPNLNLTPPKPDKGSADVIDSTAAASLVFGGKHESPLIKAPEAVQRVQVAIEPPPPPAVVRQISMDIGDPDSQVRVVIRERNGDLAVQMGAATERLRENLQNAAPLLMNELRRDNPHTVSLDFSRFGTATEGGHESNQDSRPRKQLKSEAVFADVDETAYLTGEAASAKSF